jgi:hypothetical protein
MGSLTPNVPVLTSLITFVVSAPRSSSVGEPSHPKAQAGISLLAADPVPWPGLGSLALPGHQAVVALEKEAWREAGCW